VSFTLSPDVARLPGGPAIRLDNDEMPDEDTMDFERQIR
jgi:hypothetical protein